MAPAGGRVIGRRTNGREVPQKGKHRKSGRAGTRAPLQAQAWLVAVEQLRAEVDEGKPRQR
jgi:hypothetical protein